VNSDNRLLVVSNLYPPYVLGGAEVVAHRQALRLKEKGWLVSVFAGAPPSQIPTGTIQFDIYDGIEVCRIGHRSLDPDQNFSWTYANRVFRALLSTVKPTWIHAHNLAGLGVDLIRIAKHCGIPVAVTLHDNWGYCFKNTRLRNDGSLCEDPSECHLCLPDIRIKDNRIPIRLRRDFVRARLREADLLICPSRDLARRYVEGGFDPASLTVMSNGIDLQSIKAIPRKSRKAVRFLYAGYLGEHKGIPVLLDAIDRLAEDNRYDGRWTVTIAGSGHLDSMVQRRIADKGLKASVNFVGRLERRALLDLLSETDVVLMPSSWPENEPVILLEAIASGAAVIATSLGGNSDLIVNEENGLLFNAGQPAELTINMKRIIEAPETLEAMSATNLKSRDALDEKLTISNLQQLFAKAPNRNCSRAPTIICGGRADFQTQVLLALLEKTSLSLQPQLLWSEWATDDDWRNALAYWHWNENDEIWAVEEPWRRNTPIIIPGGKLAEQLKLLVTELKVYNSFPQFIAAMELCLRQSSQPFAVNRTRGRFYRIALQTRDQSSFLMQAADQ
jgi:glycosyltransferase involved in cell wall biosynthesis